MLQLVVRAIKIIALPILVGLLSALLISGSTDLYNVLILPPFALPQWAFPIVWSIWYTAMGVSLYQYSRTAIPESEKKEGYVYFFTQLFLCFLWPILFFNLKLYFVAFIDLLLLFWFALRTVITFYRANRISGLLLVPYLIFLVYAGYLNFAVWLLNM